jgi:hypothetical protein
MAQFDGSVFGKTLTAEEKAKQEDRTFRAWIAKKYNDIKCALRREK